MLFFLCYSILPSDFWQQYRQFVYFKLNILLTHTSKPMHKAIDLICYNVIHTCLVHILYSPVSEKD